MTNRQGWPLHPDVALLRLYMQVNENGGNAENAESWIILCWLIMKRTIVVVISFHIPIAMSYSELM